MKLKDIKYKNINIEVGVYIESTPMKFYIASVLCGMEGFHTDKLITNMKAAIDQFEKAVPGNYEDLAKAIYDSCLVWTGYEDCHIDPSPLKMLIGSFVKSKGGTP